MWTSVDHRITYLQSFLCGSTAGVLGRTVTAPLDVLKITCQVKGSRTGMLSVCKQIYAMEGWRGFFRGNLSACVKIFPYYAVQVWSYKKFRWYIQDDLGRLNISGSVSAATLAVLSATVFTYPLDLIKTRLVVQPYGRHKTVYKGISHAFLSIIKTEGPRTLYNGLWPTLLGLYRVTCMLMAMASACTCKLVLKCCVWYFFFSSCINHTVYSSLLFCLIGIVFNRSVFIYLLYHYFMLHVLDYCNKDHDPLQYRWVHASYSLLQHI